MRNTLIFSTSAALLGLIAVAKANNGSEAGDHAAPQVTGEVASATRSKGHEQDKRKDRAPNTTINFVSKNGHRTTDETTAKIETADRTE